VKKRLATKKKGGGSFRIALPAYHILLESKVTAWQLGAYLCLARHTDATGKFTTSGYKRIYETTGASAGVEKQPGAARRLVKELMQMGSPAPGNTAGKLLYTPVDWKDITGEESPEIPHALYTVTFVLNDYNCDEWIWFPNELVDGFGKFSQPLKRLKQLGDVAARLLLISYRANNMEEFGGVQPYDYYFARYGMIKHIVSSHGYTFFKFGEQGVEISSTVTSQALGVKLLPRANKAIAEQTNQIRNALSSLVSQGFIYEILTVMDAPPDNLDARPVYELHNKSRTENRGEEGFARRVDRVIARALKRTPDREYEVADDLGRYHKCFPVISRAGVLPNLAGIFRLRFRINNPKNYPVRAGWQRIGRDRREWEHDLQFLEKIFGIGSEQDDSKAAIPSTSGEVDREEMMANDDSCIEFWES